MTDCFGHKFLECPRPIWKTLPEGVVDEKGTTVPQWLKSLRPSPDRVEDESLTERSRPAGDASDGIDKSC